MTALCGGRVILPENKRLENWTSPALIIDGDENEPKAGAANKSRFTEPQILAILKQGESGVPVPDLCREHGISNATYYNWRSKYGGMDASLMSEMKSMADGEPFSAIGLRTMASAGSRRCTPNWRCRTSF
jgi:putative transposase